MSAGSGPREPGSTARLRRRDGLGLASAMEGNKHRSARGAREDSGPSGHGGLDEDLVQVAPAPVFTGFEAAHDRVLRLVEMAGCVLARGVVTAADVAAFLAQPQVYPAAMGLEALLASIRCPGPDVS